jgi:hypothetical protein
MVWVLADVPVPRPETEVAFRRTFCPSRPAQKLAVPAVAATLSIARRDLLFVEGLTEFSRTTRRHRNGALAVPASTSASGRTCTPVVPVAPFAILFTTLARGAGPHLLEISLATLTIRSCVAFDFALPHRNALTARQGALAPRRPLAEQAITTFVARIFTARSYFVQGHVAACGPFSVALILDEAAAVRLAAIARLCAFRPGAPIRNLAWVFVSVIIADPGLLQVSDAWIPLTLHLGLDLACAVRLTFCTGAFRPRGPLVELAVYVLAARVGVAAGSYLQRSVAKFSSVPRMGMNPPRLHVPAATTRLAAFGPTAPS